MGKIRINLNSGTVVEKTLISCFKGSVSDYAILDNESVGSMGLPIICVCKYNGESFEKIIDPNEWGTVKENLRSIISGGTMEYVNVKPEVKANDDFYTQLTLPVASFDVLKANYAPKTVAVETPTMPTAPIMPAPVQEAPALQDPMAIFASPNVTPAAPVMPSVEIPPVAPVEPTPVVEQPTPIIPQAPVVEQPAFQTPAAPAMPEMPKPEDIQPALGNEEELEEIKQTFLLACEKMFNALVNNLKD